MLGVVWLCRLGLLRFLLSLELVLIGIVRVFGVDGRLLLVRKD